MTGRLCHARQPKTGAGSYILLASWFLVGSRYKAALGSVISFFVSVQFVAAQPTIAQDSPFEATGSVETFYYSGTNVAGSYSRPFRLAVDGCLVFIHVDPGEGDEGIEYTEFGTDGTNCFKLTKQNRTTATVNDSMLSIYARPCPPPEFGSLIAPWLAFGSRCYLNSEIDKYIYCSWIPTDRQLTPFMVKMRLSAEWHVGERGFLEWLSDFRSGFIAEADGTKKVDLPESFADNGTNNHFHVLQWTNVSGRVFPWVFELASFYHGVARQQSVVAFRHVGTTDRIQVGATRRSYIPELTRKVSVVDHRFLDEYGSVVSYLSTDKRILTESQLATRARTRGPNVAPVSNGFNRRAVMLWVIGTLVVAQIAFVAWLVLRRINNKPQQTDRS